MAQETGSADCGIPDNTGMVTPNDPDHLIIAHAAPPGPACRTALATLRLPHLERLLARLTETGFGTDPDGPPPVLSSPWDRLRAAALGLPGDAARAPWAALERRAQAVSDLGAAWAWLTPCHWQVGMDQVVLDDPARLDLQPAEAEALRAAMAPWFAEDGITLLGDADTPARWLATGAVFDGLACAPPERVAGRDVRPWLHASGQPPALQRLHSEMQMLLYTHPVNDERLARRQQPVNAFWISGAGRVPADFVPTPEPTLDTRLAAAARADDAPAWCAAWQALDASECARLGERLAQGQAVRLDLCSERAWRRLESRPQGLIRRISGLLVQYPASKGLLML